MSNKYTLSPSRNVTKTTLSWMNTSMNFKISFDMIKL